MTASWSLNDWKKFELATEQQLPFNDFPTIDAADFISQLDSRRRPGVNFYVFHPFVRGPEKWSYDVLCYGLGVKQIDLERIQFRSFQGLAKSRASADRLRVLDSREIDYHYDDFFEEIEREIEQLPGRSNNVPRFWRKEATTTVAHGCLTAFARMVEAGEVQPTTGDLTLVGKEKWGRYVEGLSELKISNTSSPVSLNYDCLLAIFAEMGLKLKTMKAIARSTGMVEANQESILMHRCSPLRLFRELVKDPEELLYVMDDCNVVLSGSRAAGHFFPQATSHASDWDFYVHPTFRHFVRFAVYLLSVGVQWELEDRTAPVYGYRLITLNGTIKTGAHTQRVQLIAHRDGVRSNIDEILHFHSSIVQCFISGFAAVSLHEPLTTSGVSRAWEPRDHYDYYSREKAQSALEKYKTRGIQYVAWKGACNPGTVPGFTVRTLADDHALCIPFEPYLKSEARCARVDREFGRLRYVRWHQFPYYVRDKTSWHRFRDDSLPVVDLVDVPLFERLVGFDCEICVTGKHACERHHDLPVELWKFFKQHLERPESVEEPGIYEWRWI